MKKRLTKKALAARYDKETEGIAIVQAFCQSDIYDILRNKKCKDAIYVCTGVVALDPELDFILNNLLEKHGPAFLFALGEQMEYIAKHRKNSGENIVDLANHKLQALR